MKLLLPVGNLPIFFRILDSLDEVHPTEPEDPTEAQRNLYGQIVVEALRRGRQFRFENFAAWRHIQTLRDWVEYQREELRD